jgi:hypothetical protein
MFNSDALTKRGHGVLRVRLGKYSGACTVQIKQHCVQSAAVQSDCRKYKLSTDCGKYTFSTEHLLL